MRKFIFTKEYHNRGIQDEYIEYLLDWLHTEKIIITSIELAAYFLFYNNPFMNSKVNQKFYKCSLSYNQITSRGASRIFLYLRNNNHINSVNLDSNQLCDACMTGLAEMLQQNQHVSHISLMKARSAGVGVTDLGIQKLVDSFNENLSLKTFSLAQHSNISEPSLQNFIKFLTKTRVEEISLEGTTLLSKQKLSIYLQFNRYSNGFTCIDLSNKFLWDHDLQKFISMIETSKRFDISSIILRSNTITHTGANQLFKHLNLHQNLKLIDVHGNLLNDDCMHELGSLIKNHNSLDTLILKKNLITDKGVEILCLALMENSFIESLDISKNFDITSNSTNILKETITKSCIQQLNVSETGIPLNDQQELVNLCASPLSSRLLPILSTSKSAAKSLIYT